MILCSIYDKKAECYDSVVAVRSPVDAIRNFEQACLSADTLLSKYPDFDLVKIGELDQRSGVITPCRAVLASNVEFLKKEGSDGE